LRDDDIPQYVEDTVADIGLVGENIVYEKKKKVEVVEKLGFGKCRLSIAVNNINAEIHEISGSVEIAPGIGLAEAICDLVSSGSTLFTNGLKEVETVLQSQAVLIKNYQLGHVQQYLLDKLLF